LQIGAEGATAPETLRQMDRRLMALWKEDQLGLIRAGLTEGDSIINLHGALMCGGGL